MSGGLDYSVDLSGEPSGIPAYLPLDTAVSSQSFDFGLELEDPNSEVVSEVRVRQYGAAESEKYEEIVGWTKVHEGSQ